MPVTKFTNLDFDQIKEQIRSYLRANSNFTDFDFEGSNMSVLIDILAYNTYISAFNSNMVVNESFLDSATLRENVVSLARNIGYVPRSRKSAEAIINFDFKFNGNSNSVKLRKGLVCVGAKNHTSYTFAIPEDITITSPIDEGSNILVNPPRTAKFRNITVYQGTLLKKFFTVNASLDQKFILDNSFIDTASIRVFVRKSGSSSGLEYSKVDNIINLDAKSNIYLIQEIKDEKYELIFGDGIFGKKNEFLRTPKYGIIKNDDDWRDKAYNLPFSKTKDGDCTGDCTIKIPQIKSFYIIKFGKGLLNFCDTKVFIKERLDIPKTDTKAITPQFFLCL